MKLEWKRIQTQETCYSRYIGNVSLVIKQHPRGPNWWLVVIADGDGITKRNVISGSLISAEKTAIRFLTQFCEEKEQEVRDIRAVLSSVS